MRGFSIWLLLAGLLVLSGIAVPYGLLGGGAAGWGVFAFWCLFGVAVVVLIAAGVRRWRV